MSDLLTNCAVCLATIVLLVVAAERFMTPARLMGLTLFRPWRGDGWPVGVQEDDDARFNWATGVTPAQPTRAEPRSDRRVTSPAAALEHGLAIEEPVGEGEVTVSLSRVEVHARAR